MKKRVLSILTALALCLTLLPATAWAAGTYTNWSQLPSTIRLNDGDTLDLSGINSIPAGSVYRQVYVVSGTATIIGNPDVPMPLTIFVGTSYSTAEAADSSTLVILLGKTWLVPTPPETSWASVFDLITALGREETASLSPLRNSAIILLSTPLPIW